MKIDTMALLVMPRIRRSELLEALEDCAADVLAICDCREARRVLNGGLPIQVVFTDTNLPDGAWADVLEAVTRSRLYAQTVVCGRLPNVALRKDVLERGAYDFLAEPYDKEEIRRLVECAAAKSYMQAEILNLPPSVLDDHRKSTIM
jgi:DNA-binding NtrC family response regulator